MLVMVLDEEGKPDEAIGFQKREIMLFPLDKTLYQTLARACYLGGKFRDSVRYWTVPMDAHPELPFLEERAEAYAALGDSPNACRDPGVRRFLEPRVGRHTALYATLSSTGSGPRPSFKGLSQSTTN